ncbi:MAG: HPr family phosphocarrier protein [Actinomycetota bacterium]|jgi:phosphotransferase system HPr (HPr) family protein|nr:HPr family phosphocarrier protein [Rubrobacter sp.]MDQ3506657.1 HPr family phosphocarrier protein [Actinomycetota bacterium]
MVEREVVVVPESGIHARPVARIVQAAKKRESNITMSKDGMEVSAKSSLRLTTLGAVKGDTVVIRADGADEEEAVEAIAAIVSSEEV